FYLIISLIFIFDIFIQFTFGKNILGFPCQMDCQRNSSFFQDELVAGTFILHFSLIGLTYHIFKDENIMTVILIFLIFLSIFFTGDRSPFGMILIIIANFLIFFKKSRIIFLKIFPIFIISIVVLLLFSEKTYKRYISNTYNIFSSSELNVSTFNFLIEKNKKQLELIDYIEKNPQKINEEIIMRKLYESDIFYLFEQNENYKYLVDSDFNKIKKNLKNIKNLIFDEMEVYQKRKFNVARVNNERKDKGKLDKWYNRFFDSQYGAHYLTAFNIFLDNFYFGAGLKSFRVICEDYNDINSLSLSSRCSTHPHNTHLEILSEFGIVGYALFLALIFIVLKEFFLSYSPNNFSFFLIFSLLLSKFFPLLPSGSFFSSLNATYFWLTLSIFFLIKHLKIMKK
ncbi:O-antigen ligase family protein, partial [Candidatus Pelagibacter sp. HIMB1521]|uniref:O-antigen ligase family protein n=1 Tax=Candidatus Pelagibacter sp. HIMB1521 TaxID=3413344 RepID=UPI003F839632